MVKRKAKPHYHLFPLDLVTVPNRGFVTAWKEYIKEGSFMIYGSYPSEEGRRSAADLRARKKRRWTGGCGMFIIKAHRSRPCVVCGRTIECGRTYVGLNTDHSCGRPFWGVYYAICLRCTKTRLGRCRVFQCDGWQNPDFYKIGMPKIEAPHGEFEQFLPEIRPEQWEAPIQ